MSSIGRPMRSRPLARLVKTLQTGGFCSEQIIPSPLLGAGKRSVSVFWTREKPSGIEARVATGAPVRVGAWDRRYDSPSIFAC